MATSSLIARSLVDQVRIYYGFWISHGTTAFPPGPAVTVAIQVYAFLTAGIALFTAWVASRAWRIINFVIFRSIYQRTKASLEESQCAALVVNNPVPVSVLLTAGKLAYRGGPKNTLFMIGVASLIGILLQATVPLYVFLFPPHKGGLIVPTHCGYDSAIADAPWKYVGKPKRFGNAALSSIDRNASAKDEVKKANLLESLPNITQFQSYVTECPSGVSCHFDHPFTFSSRYNLTSRHFGLNIRIPFTIYVNETCYRPPDAFEPILHTTQYGLDYGKVRIGDEIDPYTSRFHPVQSYAPGDTLVSYWALANNTAGYNAWTPHPTLGLGGDTTILMYFIGYISLLEMSDDPIFTTNVKLTNPTLYLTQYIAVSIICDTKYQLCTDPHNCSPIGPMTHVLEWIDNPRTSQNDTWRDISTFFNGSTFIPPISAAAQGSDAIASDQTLSHGVVQTDPSRATVFRELGRLSQGGMASLASRSQLAALGYWDLGNGSTLLPARGLCNQVAIEVPTALSIPLTPYVPYFCISIIIIIVSFADSLGATRILLGKQYMTEYMSFSVGQLHRRCMEQQLGKLIKADPRKPWPNLNSSHVGGLDVEAKEGPTSLVSTPISGHIAKEPSIPPSPSSSGSVYTHYPPSPALPAAPQNPSRINVPPPLHPPVGYHPIPPAAITPDTTHATAPEHSSTSQAVETDTTPLLSSPDSRDASYAEQESPPSPLHSPVLALSASHDRRPTNLRRSGARIFTRSSGRRELRPPPASTQDAVSDPPQHDPSTQPIEANVRY